MLVGIIGLFPIKKIIFIILWALTSISIILTIVELILIGIKLNLCFISAIDDDNTQICSIIEALFSFIFFRFIVTIPLFVLSGLKLFSLISIIRDVESTGSIHSINSITPYVDSTSTINNNNNTLRITETVNPLKENLI